MIPAASRRLGPLVLVLATVAAGPVQADCPPDTALTFLVPSQAAASAEGKVAHQFADRANAALAGRHCITTRFETAADALIAALSAGEASFAALPLPAAADVLPALDIFNLPFLFDSPHHALAWAEAVPGQTVYGEGPVVLGVLLTGALQITAPRMLAGPVDLRGLALAVAPDTPFAVKMAAAFDATAVPTGASDLAATLVTGSAQAVAADWPMIDLGGLYPPPTVITETNHALTGAAILAGPGLATALGPEDRALLENLLREVLHEQTLLAFETAAISRQAVTEDAGVIVPLDAAARAAFRTALAPVYSAAAARLGSGSIEAAVAANANARPFD